MDVVGCRRTAERGASDAAGAESDMACAKLFVPLLVVTAAMFAYAPVAIADAPYESTMLLVQKIFYFHFATWMAVTAGADRLRRGERRLSVQGHRRRPTASASRPPNWSVIFGAVRPGQRIAVGAQGLGRLVGVGRRASRWRSCSS